MRRGLKPPADLWGNVGILVTRMYDRPFDKIRERKLGAGGFTRLLVLGNYCW